MNGGALYIQADWTAENGIRLLSVRLERPPVARLFTGMRGDELLAAVPLLYSLCARAQQAAAAFALAAARNAPPPEVDPRALWRENLHECLWRLCLDWPVALGQTREARQAARAAFLTWRKRFNAPTQEFDAATATILDELQQHALRRSAPSPSKREALQPPLTEGGGFDAVGGSGRNSAAHAARLLQTQNIWQALQENRPYPVTAQGGDGSGESNIPTARGLLTHRLALDAAGCVAAYQVWAPTDRHFADAAALMEHLASARPADFAAARQALECAILALDPCVPHRIEWLQKEQET
ncbi:MAG: hypothetical protein LBQ81_12620 [Zoogloeaceae bacterium]|jgi:hypothetical protein|nr:hypothetical protein [Zoogloeaceae bacterium]